MPTYRPEGEERPWDLHRLNHRHEAIMLWLLSNPDKNLMACAEAFNYTQCTLSIIVNSGVFRERYEAMRDEYQGESLTSMREKLEAVANVSIDKLMAQLDDIEDPVFLRDTACKTLDRLGYGRSSGVTINAGPQATITVTADKGMLAQARARRETLQLHKMNEELALEEKTINGECTIEQTERPSGQGRG